MLLNATPFALLPLASGTLSLLLVLIAWRHRHEPSARAFIWLTLAACAYAFGYALEVAGADLATKTLAARLEYVGIAFVPPLVLVFALYYTGYDGWLTRRVCLLLFAVPSLTLLMVWTNDWHHLHWSGLALDETPPFSTLRIDRGPWWYVHVVSSELLLLAGTLVLIQAIVNAPQLYRGQAVALFLGILVPWVANAAYYLLGVRPLGRLDPTPTAFVLTTVCVAFALFYYRLLDLMPIARAAVLNAMQDGVIVLDRRRRVVDLNPAAQRMLGFSLDRALGRDGAELIGQALEGLLAQPPSGTSPRPDHAAEPGAFRAEDADHLFRLAGAGVAARDPELVVATEDGERYLELRVAPIGTGAERSGNRAGPRGPALPGGEVAGNAEGANSWLVLLRDITERRRAEERLRRVALYDLLTGLPTRRLLFERLEEAIAQARRRGKPLSLLVLDLLRFREVNETYGPHYGDVLLRQVAGRLRGAVRSGGATLARIGDDDFAVVLPEMGPEGASMVAAKLLAALADPFVLDGAYLRPTVEMSGRIGLACYPADAVEARELLAAAQRALAEAGRLDLNVAGVWAEPGRRPVDTSGVV